MNAEDLRLLADRAELVRGRPEHRLAEVHARIATARRRRVAAAVAGASAGVLALVIGVFALAGPTGLTKDHRPPRPANTTTPTPMPVNPSSARPLVYADDPLGDYAANRVRTVHVGDREVQIDQTLRSARSWDLHVTDAGVVYDKGDGGVWFTDGGRPRQLAAGTCRQFAPQAAIATGNAGPLAAWFDCSASQQATLVVVDTSSGHEVTRLPVPSCGAALGSTCGADTIIGEHVYFMRADGRQYRLDLATGRVGGATARMRDDDLRTGPRTLVVGDSWQTGSVEDGARFEVVGSRLVPVDPQPGHAPRRARAFEVATGQPVQLVLPGGYHPDPAPDFRGDQVSGHHTSFGLFEWLDDDTVALAQEGDMSLSGDILTCHLSDGRCRLAATGHIPADFHAPDPIRILPGGGLYG